MYIGSFCGWQERWIDSIQFLALCRFYLTSEILSPGAAGRPFHGTEYVGANIMRAWMYAASSLCANIHPSSHRGTDDKDVACLLYSLFPDSISMSIPMYKASKIYI